MALQSFGLVTVTSSGTPVRCTANESVPATRVAVQSFQVEVAPGNAGLIYVGTAAMVISSGVGVLAVLPKPTSATTGPFPSYSPAIVNAPAGINLNDIYLDASTSGDKAYVSAAVQ